MVATLLASFLIGKAPHHSRPVSTNKRKRDVSDPNPIDVYEAETDRICRAEIDRLFDDYDSSDQFQPSQSKNLRMVGISDVSGIRAGCVPWNHCPIAHAFKVEDHPPIFQPTYTKPEWDAAVRNKDYTQSAVGMTREAAVKEIAAMKYFIDIDCCED